MTAPASPCTGVCKLNLAGVCRGCGRTLQEIGEWPTATDTRRRAIADAARLRRKPDRPKRQSP